MRNSDEPRAAGQTVSVAALALLVLACDPSAPMLRDGGPDAAVEVDAGRDASMREDAMIVDGGSLPRTCVRPSSEDPSGTDRWEDALGRATVTVDGRDACRRSYTLTTTAPLRHADFPNPRVVTERAGAPTVRSGHDVFDALYAMALEEVRELSVSSIRDFAFDEGRAVDCGGCFETGRHWNYVWTRDTAYAVHLGLASVDPPRSRASLEFKLSERRGGGGLQIVQDTGTGGSYPVSTDRVSWAVGAAALLPELTGEAREAFRDRTYLALRNTIEHDRRVVFDSVDRLYFGEQSFLDWREQTYPDWTAGDVVHIAMSKALSTNLLHLRAIDLTGELAREVGDDDLAARYEGWATELRETIRARFWLEEEGLFSTYVTTFLDPAPVHRYDLLGSAFAVLFGVASEAQAARILESYPHYGPGAVVVWPQQQRTPIYHNRGEWPFVTAYWLRAAKHVDNDAVADRMVRALIRGAALNLSNMENFEAETGAAWVEEPPYSGPVVNSERQLWSVAGYLSMVHHTIFGLEPSAEGLRVRPYLTGGLSRTLFADSDAVVLNDYPWRGRTVTVVLHLPDAAGRARLAVESVRLNGQLVAGDLLPEGMLEAQNRVDVVLTDGGASSARLTEISPTPWRNVFGPRTPRISAIRETDGRLELVLDPSGEDVEHVTWTVYRDGVVVDSGLPGSTTTWIDPSSDPGGAPSPCYVVETTFTASGNRSQHSPPQCWWGRGVAHITTIGASAMDHVGGSPSGNHGRFHYEGWGDAGHSLTVPSFSPTRSGPHLLQLTFGNGSGPISTGITCAIKRIVVEDTATGAVVAEGPVVMPHLGRDDWSRWEGSSFVRADLVAGRTYRIVIRGDDDMVNMSAFAHFEPYTGGPGGRTGEHNRVNIAELKILAL